MNGLNLRGEVWIFLFPLNTIPQLQNNLLVVGHIDDVLLDEAEVGAGRRPGDLEGGVVEGGYNQVLRSTRQQILKQKMVKKSREIF